MAEARSGNPIFIGGVPRSGTTLLRVILDSHPRIFCGTELRVIYELTSLWATAEGATRPLLSAAYGIDVARLRTIFRDLILSFLTPAWHTSRKSRVAEKTPANLLVFPELHVLFPESPLIHVIRDGRDVVASRLEHDRQAAGAPGDTGELAAAHAREWANAMASRRSLLAGAEPASAYFEVRYESLVRDPEPTLAALFAFLGEAFDPGVLAFHRIERNVAGTEEWSADAVRRPIFTSSIGRWRNSLSAEELSAAMPVMREALAELGYD